MFASLVNLRIGTKLGITSAISLLLVVGLVVLQFVSSAKVTEGTAALSRNEENAIRAVNINASVRGMMVGVRDLRLAATPEDIKKATDYLNARHTSAVTFVEDLIKITRLPEQRQRGERSRTLIEQYFAVAKEIEKLKSEAAALQANGASAGGEVAGRISSINRQIDTLARERGLVAAQELDTLASATEEFAKARSEESKVEVQEVMANADRLGIGLGIVVAIVMIGAVAFSIATIAKPIRSLTGGMHELARRQFRRGAARARPQGRDRRHRRRRSRPSRSRRPRRRRSRPTRCCGARRPRRKRRRAPPRSGRRRPRSRRASWNCWPRGSRASPTATSHSA